MRFLLLSALALDPFGGWYLVGGSRNDVHFADADSLKGPLSARQLRAELRYRSTYNGVSRVLYRVEIDCRRRTSRYTSKIEYGREGQIVAIQSVPGPARPISPGSAGAVNETFACNLESGPRNEVGFPVMIDRALAADRFIRLLGIGLSRQAAGALAGVDNRRAPKAFNEILNLLVPANMQDLALAIIDPDAPHP